MAREKKKKQQQQVDYSNTLRGTAELRRQRSQEEWSCTACTSLNKASNTSCNVCGTNRLAGREGTTVDTSIDRGPRDHRAGVNGSFATLDRNSSASASSNYGSRISSNNSGGDVSICPFCSRRFSDPVDLIQHCEAVHPDNGSVNNSRPTPKKKGKKCICS